jgi:enoyl-CoA hydratase
MVDVNERRLIEEQLLGNGVMLLTMRRPEKLNALGIPLLETLVDALSRITEDTQIRCVILTGSGKAFSAGADIADFVARGVSAYMDPRRLQAWRMIEEFPKPIIAAVNGYALGGGLELAMLCDLIIASETARFGQAEINIAGIPGDGGTQRLPRLIGRPLATEMILTGRMIDADEARDAGLVLRVVPADNLIPATQELAEEISSKAPLTVRTAKTALKMAFEEPLSKGNEHERELMVDLFATEDQAEGTRAFIEKRPPVFKGR